MFSFQAIHNTSYITFAALSNVKEPLSMFSFQAIHNGPRGRPLVPANVKEPLSMFSFQAIHNDTISLIIASQKDPDNQEIYGRN